MVSKNNNVGDKGAVNYRGKRWMRRMFQFELPNDSLNSSKTSFHRNPSLTWGTIMSRGSKLHMLATQCLHSWYQLPVNPGRKKQTHLPERISHILNQAAVELLSSIPPIFNPGLIFTNLNFHEGEHFPAHEHLSTWILIAEFHIVFKFSITKTPTYNIPHKHDIYGSHNITAIHE